MEFSRLIQLWLAKAARGELHDPAQPPDPLFYGADMAMWDARIDLPKVLKADLRAAKRDYYDVVCFTHLDDDHCCGSGEITDRGAQLVGDQPTGPSYLSRAAPMIGYSD
jgi:hypothetical protein